MLRIAAALALSLSASASLAAKDSLGIFGNWGAFRDATGPRCYAIAKAVPSRLERDHEPFATVATWPTRKLRGQVHFRLSRTIRDGSAITLRIAGQRFELTGGGGDAWAADRRMDAAVVAAMRSARSMNVSGVDRRGRRFTNAYDLDGAPSAIDAATLGCARR